MVISRKLAKEGPVPLLLMGLLATVCEFDFIDRTIDSVRLFGFAAGVGVLAALYLAAMLNRLAFSNEPCGARACYVLILATGLATMSVCFASILNRAYAPETFELKEFDLVSKGHRGKGNTPYIEVAMPNGRETFDVTPLVWSSVANQVCFSVAPGNLGFDRVIYIQSCEKNAQKIPVSQLNCD